MKADYSDLVVYDELTVSPFIEQTVQFIEIIHNIIQQELAKE